MQSRVATSATAIKLHRPNGSGFRKVAARLLKTCNRRSGEFPPCVLRNLPPL